MSSPVNDTLVRDIVEEVLSRLGRGGTTQPSTPAPSKSCGCSGSAGASACSTPTAASSNGRRRYGVYQDAKEAAAAAHGAFQQLSQKGVEGRRKIVEIVKKMSEANAEPWGRIELDETKIGRLDHKIEKLKGLRAVPGVEFLNPYGLSGDHGITLEEFAPFGVIGAVTPSTHSIPTVACNIISMVSAGNAVVFNAHPGAARCAAMAIKAFNEAIYWETGIESIACIIEQPTLDSFQAIAAAEQVRLLCVTGGPGVVKAAMQTGKRAICAGPGNPPVLVDGTSCLDRAARNVILGAAYDNNLLCIGEKEVFVLEPVFEKFMTALEKHGAARLSESQVERLTKEAFTFPTGQGAGCGHPSVNRKYLGQDPDVLAKAAGVNLAAGTQLLFGETPADHLFVEEEQMMPFVPIVRVKSVEEGIALAKKAEHGYKHSAMIHSHDVSHMTAMAKALDTTIFVKNGSCLAGLGGGGEGYPNFSIATTTGEGICNPRTYARMRRCCMVDNLRIF